MKGLVLKELYAAKTTLKSALTSAVIFTVMAIGMKSPGYLGAALMILISTCVINSIAYDESSKWDMMLITMPVTAKQAVGAKYVSFLLFDVIGFVYSAVIYAVIEKDLPGACIFGGSMAVAAILYMSLLVPVYVKYGVQKARMIFFAAIFLPIFLIVLLASVAKDIGISMIFISNEKAVFIALSAVAALCFIVSLNVSAKIYSKKDF